MEFLMKWKHPGCGLYDLIVFTIYLYGKLLVCWWFVGFCDYGGTLHKVGDEFVCLDGTNQCWCMDNNIVGSTMMPQDYDTMCR